ncbi:hypothetical protein JKF63_01353 [Porcisia hertigi]|uniref:Mitochondrial import inner membrane translocase subunit TIM50 n=1 Tax=Porcisia hertigi TaxID=2761500 RepID=A0A836L9V7_9TRYP|nr:hypothetical protein JKF63_01353 [Porcisia hertigi]
MPTGSSVAVTGECRLSACGATAVMPSPPAVPRSTVLGDSRSSCTPAHKRSLYDVATPLYGEASQHVRRRRCPTPDAAVPRHRKDAGSTVITTDSHYSLTLGNVPYGVPPGKRNYSPLVFSVKTSRKSSLALPIAPAASLNGDDARNDVSARESAPMSVEALPTLSPTKVAAASDSAIASPNATPATANAVASPVSPRASHFPRRLSCALRCSRICSGGKDFTAFAFPTAPTLYATEEEPPVSIDPEGVRCCPLISPRYEEDANASRSPDKLTDEQINLSPFLSWKFVPYLSPPAEGEDTARPTVVLDMDETLLHTSVEPMPDADAEIDVPSSSDDAQGAGSSITSSRYRLFIKYRPYLGQFLRFCLDHFEVVIFTASKAFYARAVLRQLQADIPGIIIRFDGEDVNVDGASKQRSGDPARVIELLHRDHCTPTNVGYTKDLHLIGRDLRRTILVDNNKVCSVFQPYNSIHVKDFARRRYAKQVPDPRRMRAAQLHHLKGSLIPAAVSVSEDAATLPPLNPSECSTSTFDWEDNEDTVLLRLCSVGGLLHRLSRCENVPSFMQRTVRFNQYASR